MRTKNLIIISGINFSLIREFERENNFLIIFRTFVIPLIFINACKHVQINLSIHHIATLKIRTRNLQLIIFKLNLNYQITID